MPRVFKIGSYIVYFWVNENDPLEQYMSMYARVFLRPPLRKYGLHVMEAVFFVIINQKFQINNFVLLCRLLKHEAKIFSIFGIQHSIGSVTTANLISPLERG